MSSKKKQPSKAGASRAPQGSSSFTALSPAYETRELKIAYGIQFHPGESLHVTPQKFLRENLEISHDLEKVSDSEYINHLQGIRFTIEETTSKQKFIEWLKTPEVHLIYMGHARYGRGPCFGAKGIVDPDAKPQVLVTGEDWEQGSNSDSGLFRMGFPFIGIPASEIPNYGYTANLMKDSQEEPSSEDCDPELRGHLGHLKSDEPEDIFKGLSDHLRNYRNGDKYYWYHSPHGRAVIHYAGWRNTASAPSDLGTYHDAGDPDNTQVKCRAFAHLGCSTYLHNYELVRKVANWQRSGNERYAFWTTAPSYPHAVGPWVHAVISYGQWNAFAPWGPSLQWAVQRTNRSILKYGGSYQLI